MQRRRGVESGKKGTEAMERTKNDEESREMGAGEVE